MQCCHPRAGGDPVRRGLSVQSSASLEYWVARSSRAMTTGRMTTLSRRDAPLCGLSSGLDDTVQGSNVRQDKIRTRNGSVELDLTAVDPGNGQSKWLAADQIGELRLSG